MLRHMWWRFLTESIEASISKREQARWLVHIPREVAGFQVIRSPSMPCCGVHLSLPRNASWRHNQAEKGGLLPRNLCIKSNDILMFSILPVTEITTMMDSDNTQWAEEAGKRGNDQPSEVSGSRHHLVYHAVRRRGCTSPLPNSFSARFKEHDDSEVR